MNESMPTAPRSNPFLETIGAREVGAGATAKAKKKLIASAKSTQATVTCDLANHIRNYAGNMHGGVIAAVAEAAARAALRKAFPRGKHATVELKMNYFRPIVPGDPNAKIDAIADLLPTDSRICVANVDVFDAQKNLAAAAIVTMHR